MEPTTSPRNPPIYQTLAPSEGKEDARRLLQLASGQNGGEARMFASPLSFPFEVTLLAFWMREAQLNTSGHSVPKRGTAEEKM